MHDLDPAQLRRQAAASARSSQRNLRLILFGLHVLLFLIALAAFAAMTLGVGYVFSTLWNSVDVSLIVFGLFAGWGIGLLLHGASVVVDSGWMERQFRHRAAAGVVGRALLDDDADAGYPSEWMKAKRNLIDEIGFSVDDDGELIEDEARAQQARK